MTALLLHGVVPEDLVPGDAPPHLRVTSGGLTALSSLVHDPADALRDPDDAVRAALSHHALLSAQQRIGPVVPVRFGALFSGPPAVLDHLAEAGARYRAVIARVGHAVEMGLSVASLDETDGRERPDVADGRGYLHARSRAKGRNAARRRARQDFLAALARDVATWARDVRPLGRGPERRLLSLSLLLPMSECDRLSERVGARAAEARTLGLRLTLSRPMPAYSFVAEPGHG